MPHFNLNYRQLANCSGSMFDLRVLIINFSVVRFFSAVDSYLDRYRDDSLIGIHCTHGVNRTGYMIARYMIQRMGYGVSEALSCISSARGFPIERPHFIADLGKHLQRVPDQPDGHFICKGKAVRKCPALSPTKVVAKDTAAMPKERVGRANVLNSRGKSNLKRVEPSRSDFRDENLDAWSDERGGHWRSDHSAPLKQARRASKDHMDATRSQLQDPRQDSRPKRDWSVERAPQPPRPTNYHELPVFPGSSFDRPSDHLASERMIEHSAPVRGRDYPPNHTSSYGREPVGFRNDQAVYDPASAGDFPRNRANKGQLDWVADSKQVDTRTEKPRSAYHERRELQPRKESPPLWRPPAEGRRLSPPIKRIPSPYRGQTVVPPSNHAMGPQRARKISPPGSRRLSPSYPRIVPSPPRRISSPHGRFISPVQRLSRSPERRITPSRGRRLSVSPRRQPESRGHMDPHGILPQRGGRVSPQRGHWVSPPRGGRMSPQRGSRISPQRGSRISPQRGSRNSPQRGRRISPHRVSRISPQRGNRISPQRGTRISPHRGTRISPQRGSRMSPQRGSHMSPQRGSRMSPKLGSRMSPQRGSRISPQRGNRISPQRGKRMSPHRGSRLSPQRGHQIRAETGIPQQVIPRRSRSPVSSDWRAPPFHDAPRSMDNQLGRKRSPLLDPKLSPTRYLGGLTSRTGRPPGFKATGLPPYRDELRAFNRNAAPSGLRREQEVDPFPLRRSPPNIGLLNVQDNPRRSPSPGRRHATTRTRCSPPPAPARGERSLTIRMSPKPPGNRGAAEPFPDRGRPRPFGSRDTRPADSRSGRSNSQSNEWHGRRSSPQPLPSSDFYDEPMLTEQVKLKSRWNTRSFDEHLDKDASQPKRLKSLLEPPDDMNKNRDDFRRIDPGLRSNQSQAPRNRREMTRDTVLSDRTKPKQFEAAFSSERSKFSKGTSPDRDRDARRLPQQYRSVAPSFSTQRDRSPPRDIPRSSTNKWDPEPDCRELLVQKRRSSIGRPSETQSLASQLLNVPPEDVIVIDDSSDQGSRRQTPSRLRDRLDNRRPRRRGRSLTKKPIFTRLEDKKPTVFKRLEASPNRPSPNISNVSPRTRRR